MKKCLLTGFPVMTDLDYERYYGLTTSDALSLYKKELKKFGPRSKMFYKAWDLLKGIGYFKEKLVKDFSLEEMHPVYKAMNGLTVPYNIQRRNK